MRLIGWIEPQVFCSPDLKYSKVETSGRMDIRAWEFQVREDTFIAVSYRY